MEVLTTIKAYEPVGNRTPVNKPYVINTNRKELLPVTVSDNPTSRFMEEAILSGEIRYKL